MNKNNEAIKQVLAAIVSISTFLIIWHFSTYGTTLGKILPGPNSVLIHFFKSFTQKIGKYTMSQHILWSLSRVLTGYCMAALCGIPLGLMMARYKIIEAVFKPFYEMIRPIPPIAWISLAILWFGLGEQMKYFIIFLSAFNNITINVYMGGKSVDPELIGVAKMLGATESQIFRTVIVPATIPYIFAGLQVGISVSWAAVVAAEMVRSSMGLGWIIVSGMEMNDVSQILVGVIAIALVGFLLAILMRGLETKLVEWNERGV